ncbi:hypothetical protein [Lichenifustis flavocetrariae]|uniref:SIS domain-containing protein n=1 Tax=Lichenifustis flavocetrariae TaxID=2949735 RepID=A0AA41Z7T7_9HYPH|nr:hypothetical protein [Lichenifustis flavocetrariae]MCW6512083.1 hypothetical protein [Lichenifustis flavocetrariae]
MRPKLIVSPGKPVTQDAESASLSRDRKGQRAMREETMAAPWAVVERELSALLAQVDPSQFEHLAKAFEAKDGRLFFSGQGRSGLIAQMAAVRLMHAGYAGACRR